MAKAAISSNIAQRRLQARLSGDKDYQQRREQLLKAAGRVFQEKGFKGASINDVARAVGIDRASLYYYTSGKEELFREMVHEATLANIEMAETIRASKIPPDRKIRDFITSLMRSYETHYPYLYVYVQEDMTQIAQKSTRWAREMNKLAKRFDQAVIGIVQEGLDDGTFRSNGGTAAVIAFGIIGMCNWSHRWFKPTGKLSGAMIGTVFADMILDGLTRRSGRRQASS
jgi:AcrR family transcriptional regulator